MEVDVAARAKRAATAERTVVASRLAAICDMIKDHRDAGTPLNARRVAAMIDDLAAEGRPSSGRRKRRIDSATCYEKVHTLGAGGFGVVVRARHRATGHDVAVKSPLTSHGCDGGDKEIRLLLREACFVAACQGHPSVVGFRGVARAPGPKDDYSLVMEYVGPNLAQVLRKRGRPFREAKVRPMMRQLLEAAVAMHEHGVVHRDIKPGNILVGHGGGTLKICDFGLAKYMNEEKAPAYIAGTSGYMAPEMLLWNKDHDTRVDTWSLGCVMAELLTGRMLFYGKKDHADQLCKIFDVLGVPGKRAWQTSDKDLGEMVQQWQARQRRLGHRNRLRELIPKEILSRDGFEVLKGLLTCDPKKRLTAAAALRCPWFNDNNKIVVDPPVSASATSNTKVCGKATKSLSLVWQMAMSFTGRALQMLRPKRLFMK